MSTTSTHVIAAIAAIVLTVLTIQQAVEIPADPAGIVTVTLA